MNHGALLSHYCPGVCTGHGQPKNIMPLPTQSGGESIITADVYLWGNGPVYMMEVGDMSAHCTAPMSCTGWLALNNTNLRQLNANVVVPLVASEHTFSTAGAL